MIDICVALDQLFSPHTGVQSIKIPGFSGRRYFKRLVPTPFFGSRLRRQNFNHAPKQYRQLRRLEDNLTDDICYLEDICSTEQPFIS